MWREVSCHAATVRQDSGQDREDHIDRRGICLSCHQEIPDRSLPVSLLHHVAKYTGNLPKTTEQHNSLIHYKIFLLSGWMQVGAVIGGSIVVLAGGLWYLRRRRRGKVGSQ